MSSSNEDPVVRSTRREVIAVLGVTAIALTYTIITCYRLGFDRSRELKFVKLFAGIAFPEWVFWGIVVPWLASFVIGGLFALRFMSDADLGEELEEDDDPFATAQSAASAKQEGEQYAG